jgi:hypothetical protein
MKSHFDFAGSRRKHNDDKTETDNYEYDGCVSLFIEYRVKDELCPPCIHGLARARRPSPN